MTVRDIPAGRVRGAPEGTLNWRMWAECRYKCSQEHVQGAFAEKTLLWILRAGPQIVKSVLSFCILKVSTILRHAFGPRHGDFRLPFRAFFRRALDSCPWAQKVFRKAMRKMYIPDHQKGGKMMFKLDPFTTLFLKLGAPW